MHITQEFAQANPLVRTREDVIAAGPPIEDPEFFKNHFGSGYEAAKLEYAEAGIDLETQPPLRPWTHVSHRLQKFMTVIPEEQDGATEIFKRWPDVLDGQFLKENFGFKGDVDDILLGDVTDLTAELNAQIDDLAAVTTRTMSAILERKFESGDYEYSPYITYPREQEEASGGLYQGSAFVSGWAVRWQLNSQDNPEVEAMLDELSLLRSKRDNQVVNYLRSL